MMVNMRISSSAMCWQPDISCLQATSLGAPRRPPGAAAAPEAPRCSGAGLRRRAGSTGRRGGARARAQARCHETIFSQAASQGTVACRPLGMFAFAPFTALRLPNPVRAVCSRAAVPLPFERCGAGAKLCCTRGPRQRHHAATKLPLGADFWRAAAPVRGPMAFALLQMPLLERSCDERCGARPRLRFLPECNRALYFRNGGAARVPVGALPRIAARAPQLRPGHPRRSSEDENSGGSELDDVLSDYEVFGTGGKCRRARGPYRAPKPYARPNWTEQEDACLRRCVRARVRACTPRGGVCCWAYEL